MNTQPIAITGLGIASACGFKPSEVWSNLRVNSGGLSELTLFDSPKYGKMPVGQIRKNIESLSGLHCGSRTEQLAVYAAKTAAEYAGLNKLTSPQRQAVGVVHGTCTGGMLDSEIFLAKLAQSGKMDAQLLRHHSAACSADTIAKHLSLNGFRATVSSACASGASAIITACDVINSGQADIVLAGGTDSLTRLTINGFGSLLIVDPDGCRPFDAGRAGISLGEGSGMLVLESAKSAMQRNTRIYAWLIGWANTCDAYHPTAPLPDGSGAALAMQAALDTGRIRPSKVGYINAHGTGTPNNDLAETLGITKVFGDHIPLVSSTKRMFGHTLAAAGAIEAIVCILALRHQLVPGTAGLRNIDPKLPFQPIKDAVKIDFEIAMSNSLGFGGNSCSLLLARDLPDCSQGGSL